MKLSHLFTAAISRLPLIMAIMTPLQAADYIELESKPGDALNNSLGTAEAIDPALFTTPEPGNVFARPGSLTASVRGTSGRTIEEFPNQYDVDFFSFSTPGSLYQLAMFDIDDTTGIEVDTVIALYDASGRLLAFDDDMDVVDPGSEDDETDSFVGEIALPPGSYVIAVSWWDNFPVDKICTDPLIRPDGEDGGESCTSGTASFENPAYTLDTPINPNDEGPYTLHISLLATDSIPQEKPKFMPWLPLLLE